MTDFKKLPCMAGCPVDSGFVDCNGDTIYEGAAIATCDNIPAPVEVSVTDTIDGNKIATITVDGVATDIDETITEIKSFGFDPATHTLTIVYKDESGAEVSKDTHIPQIDAVLHIAPDSIDPAVKYPQYYNKIVSGGDGLFYGFAPDGTATPLNFLETITSITDVLAYSNKHEIFKYNNESGSVKSAYETVTTLKGISFDKSTSILSVTYTDEMGDDITKTAEVKAQVPVYINGAAPASATIFSLESPPLVNNNALKNNDDYIYIGTDGSYWTWNGTTYVSAPAPAGTTEWYLAATSVDAQGNKTASIARTGWVFIGANKNPTCVLDLENAAAGTAFMNVVRMIASNQNVAGRTTMFTMGAQQSVGNLADWRFYYAGNASPNNRSDFGFTGNASPNFTMLYGGLNGVGTTAPMHRWDVNGSFGFAIRGSGGSTSQGAQDGTVVITTAGSAYTLMAADASTNRRVIAIKNVSGGNITVTGHIDLVAGTTLTIPAGGSWIFQSNGTSWFKLADATATTLSEIGARVGRGVDVTLDNLKFRLSASGNPSLQVSTTTGTDTLNGTSWSNLGTTLVAGRAVTTTPAYLVPALVLDQAGYVQKYTFNSNSAAYEVTLVINPGYSNNSINIKRLA